jgi:hypothetical protein
MPGEKARRWKEIQQGDPKFLRDWRAENARAKEEAKKPRVWRRLSWGVVWLPGNVQQGEWQGKKTAKTSKNIRGPKTYTKKAAATHSRPVDSALKDLYSDLSAVFGCIGQATRMALW